MVISNLKGGLGNYLFQIAAGYSLAIDNNDSFTIDERMILQVHSHWSVYSTNIFRNVPVTNGVINFNYYKYESLKHQLIPYVDNILIDGYFQSEKYWKGNEDKILELFKIDENTLEYLTQKYPDIIGADKHFVIFSNDIEWCKENFKGIKATFVKSKLDFMDLYLMSLCKDNITANSTFSWWGSYLNMNPNKRVVTPATWFIHTHPNEDVIPESWIKI